GGGGGGWIWSRLVRCATDQRCAVLIGVPVKPNPSMATACGSLAMVISKQINRACFPTISGCERPPAILWSPALLPPYLAEFFLP
ncbi:hypothetical protein D2N39_22320, partial [Gemmobacter lutimaris]